MISNHDLSVGLLMSEVEEAEHISHVFRKIGIIPCYFESLENFWYQTIKNPLSLVVVDVLMMSDDTFILRDHPMVKDNKMPMTFYYSKETSPLLAATYDYFHYGLIQKGKNYDSMLKVILGRINKVRSMEYDLETIKRKLYHSQMKNNELTEIVGQVKRDQDIFSEMVSYVKQRLEKNNVLVTFEDLLSEMMEKLFFVKKFSFLKLSENEQELYSQKSSSTKCKELPSIKLGALAKKDGVMSLIHDMALGVALEVLGENCRPIIIYDENERMDLIIFINSMFEASTFNWDIFEILLRQIYLKFSNQKKKALIKEQYPTPWQLLSYIDDDCRVLDSQMTLGIYVDFTSLIEMIKDERDNRFCWSGFMEDFVNNFSLQCQQKFRVSHMGIHHLIFLIDRALKKNFQNNLEAFVSSFPFDRYFENEQRLSQEIPRPIIDNLPIMANEYLKLI